MPKSKASWVAFAFGILFPLVFFLFNDPDRAKVTTVVIWHCIVLIPAGLVICVLSDHRLALSAATMLSGIFVGTCAAILVHYPERANLFPVAAALWTIVAAIPVALGCAIGSLIAIGRRVRRKNQRW
ncbi:MAG: hypothetical protein H6Q07_2041 [Acidobacteria bacterium]|nr:hypothetical protein [Acidobacteriota bacterium]